MGRTFGCLNFLIANDIDTYHGDFTTDPNAEFDVDMRAIKYHKVDGLDLEINTVKCHSLSPDSFLANNDLNVTASCIHVNFAADKLFSVHASPQFWMFLFQPCGDRTIQTVNTVNIDNYGATTAILELLTRRFR